MSRYTGPRLRVTRRLGYLPGFTSKLGTRKKRRKRPGQHGNSFTKRTEYAKRLREKQKLRFNYGVNERHLVNYVKKAKRLRGATATILLQLLEMRLDNLIFRSNIAPTTSAARQLVRHKHVRVNNKCISIPSYQCKPGDRLIVNVKNYDMKALNQKSSSRRCPTHLFRRIHKKNVIIKIRRICTTKQTSLRLNELFIIEFYSRKI